MIAMISTQDGSEWTLDALAVAYVGGTGLAITCQADARFPAAGLESAGFELRRLLVNGEPRVVVIVRHAARCNVDIMEGEPW